MDHRNPLAQVRASCLTATDTFSSVSIVESAIETNAISLSKTRREEFSKGVEWDASGWHSNADVWSNAPLTVQFIFVMDAMNFCFWPSPTSFECDVLAKFFEESVGEWQSCVWCWEIGRHNWGTCWSLSCCAFFEHTHISHCIISGDDFVVVSHGQPDSVHCTACDSFTGARTSVAIRYAQYLLYIELNHSTQSIYT
jgi:hypothetical protein